MDFNIVSDGQFQELNKIKTEMSSIDTISNLRQRLKDMQEMYQHILNMKNSDNSKEFLSEMKKRIKAIDVILNV